MSRPQRIAAVFYCLLVIYCCIWVPWHVVQGSGTDGFVQFRTGYGWLWEGPNHYAGGRAIVYSTPDFAVTGLRLLAATAVAAAAFLLAGRWGVQ
jgi:hypothetical protein